MSQDAVIVALLIVSLLLGNLSLFLKDWVPTLLFYFVYEFARGHLSTIQNLLHISVNMEILYQADKLMFGANIPVLIAQKLIQPNVTIIDYVSFVWYTSFFWFPILTGFLFWIKDREFFKIFRNAYIILCFMALVTFMFFPAAPPWMASQHGILPPLNTDTWGRLYVGGVTLGLFSTVGTNPVAPFPSLHIGWSVLSAYMLQQYFKKKIKGFSYLFYLYPLIMCFVVTYTSDHYVIDMIGGAVYAAVAVFIAKNMWTWISKIKQIRKIAVAKE